MYLAFNISHLKVWLLNFDYFVLKELFKKGTWEILTIYSRGVSINDRKIFLKEEADHSVFIYAKKPIKINSFLIRHIASEFSLQFLTSIVKSHKLIGKNSILIEFLSETGKVIY